MLAGPLGQLLQLGAERDRPPTALLQGVQQHVLAHVGVLQGDEKLVPVGEIGSKAWGDRRHPLCVGKEWVSIKSVWTSTYKIERLNDCYMNRRMDGETDRQTDEKTARQMEIRPV